MSWMRNLLITIGAFWLSRQTVVPMALLFGKATSGIVYHDVGIFSATAFGVMSGMGRAVSAAFGAAIVTFFATGQKPQRWALVVALLYVLAAQPHYHWINTPTNLDRLSQIADVLWPAVVCLSVAALIGWQRGRHSMTAGNETPGASS